MKVRSHSNQSGSRETALLTVQTISKAERDSIMAREERLKAYCVERGFTDKRSGWTSYKPEQVAHLNPPTNGERSQVELFDFVHDVPEKYFLYINEKTNLATTWTGVKLGDVWFGREYQTPSFGRASKRVPVTIKAVNGRTYHGTYFKSAGDYARVKLAKH